MSILRSRVAKRQIVVLIAIAAMIGIFSFLSPHFLTSHNFSIILKDLPELGLLSIGMSLVMITGGIDISAGAVLGVAAIIIGKSMLGGAPGWLSAISGLLIGGTLGLLNGVIIVYGRVTPIIATLGTMYIWRALIFLLVGAHWLAGIPHTFDPVVKKAIIGLPIPFLLLLGLTFLLEGSFRETAFGRHIVAVGDSETSARLAGVNTKWVTILTYTLMGILAGIAAFLYVGKYRNVEMTVGTGMTLEAIAAATIGGTSILGGEGTVLGCLLGIFFIRLIENGLVLLKVPSLWDDLVLGGIIVLALSFDLLGEKR